MANQKNTMTKRKRFVNEGIFMAELDEFLTRTLAEDGYAGVEVRATPFRTEVLIRATRTRDVLGEKSRRIRELTSLVQKRFNYENDNVVELFAERVESKWLCATAQAESLRFKLDKGVQCRKACFSVLKKIMENGAMGCEVTVSGKMRAARAKVMKVKEGLMISTGDPAKYYVDTAIRSLKLRQGVIGIKVKIMFKHDPTGKLGPAKPLPDTIIVMDPKPVEPPRVVQSQAKMSSVEEIVEPEGEVEVDEEGVAKGEYTKPAGEFSSNF